MDALVTGKLPHLTLVVVVFGARLFAHSKKAGVMYSDSDVSV